MCVRALRAKQADMRRVAREWLVRFDQDIGRGDDAVGRPRRAQICQFELFELLLLSKLDEQLSIE